jgi:hypothetical protein
MNNIKNNPPFNFALQVIVALAFFVLMVWGCVSVLQGN